MKTFYLGALVVLLFGVCAMMYSYVNQSYQSSGVAFMNAVPGGEMMQKDSFALNNEAGVMMAPVAREMMNQVPMAPEQGVMRKEIKTGTLALVVDDVFSSVEKVLGFVKTQNGFVVSSYISKDTRFPSASVSLRVPAANFDLSMTDLKKFGEVKSVQVQGQDVTEQYVDLEARLKNLRATEGQFSEIMKKAQKIEEILAVQAQLSQVRGEIESLEGRKKYLDQNVDYSVITLSLSTSEDQLPVIDSADQWKPLGVLKDAVRDLLDLGKGILNFVIWVLVFSPVWLVFLGVFYFVKRKMRQ